MKNKPFPWVRILVHLWGVVPLVGLGINTLTGQLGVNPIQEAEQRLGRAALYFLVAALSVTPLITLTGWRSLAPRRRALGLYAFLYASLHFTVFSVLDYGFDLPEIARLTLEKPYILLGLATGLILLALAATSFNFFMRRMGKRWKSLHRLAYLAGLTVIIHYAWASKGNLFALSGDILKPLLWGLLVLLLLLLRLPAIRRWVSQKRTHLAHKLRP